MLSAIPLLLAPIVAYNIVAFASPLELETVLFRVPMVSEAIWPYTVADAIVTLAIAALFVEIIKATRTGTVSIVDHALSTMVFIGALLEFILVAEAATSTFFIITLIAFIDVVAGYSITIRAARRDFSVGPGNAV